MKEFASIAAALLICLPSIGNADGPAKINHAETVLKDTRGRTIGNAYCAVYPDYGYPHTFMTRSVGQASLFGPPGALMFCVKEREAYEVKVPSGSPRQVLMKPLGEGGCYVYNILPVGTSIVACSMDKTCEWLGGGPHGACRGIPRPQ